PDMKINVSKTAFQDCGQWFLEAKILLLGTKQEIQRGDYDMADHSVYKARGFNFNCRSEVDGGESRAVIPTGVSYEMRVFEELSEGAMRIIERL
ncbi:unnamed protein product, partial [Ilex paraguariensis]